MNSIKKIIWGRKKKREVMSSLLYLIFSLRQGEREKKSLPAVIISLYQKEVGTTSGAEGKRELFSYRGGGKKRKEWGLRKASAHLP